MSKIISALAFATLLALPASAAANREVTAPRILVTNASASCPTLEGYPTAIPMVAQHGAHIANMLAVVTADLTPCPARL
jgi:hypothetical protein